MAFTLESSPSPKLYWVISHLNKSLHFIQTENTSTLKCNFRVFFFSYKSNLCLICIKHLYVHLVTNIINIIIFLCIHLNTFSGIYTWLIDKFIYIYKLSKANTSKYSLICKFLFPFFGNSCTL